MVREMLSGSWLVTVLAIVVALLIGGVLIAGADARVQATAGYLFARPADFFGAVWDAVYSAYVALFRGAVYDFQAGSFTRAIRPLTESLVFSVPLILTGLGIAVAFRAGLFNIGGQGQIIVGGIVGGYIGFGFDLPVVLHVTLAAIGAALGGAIWGGIAGVLKAKTGANEVIVTIMLNNIAVYLIAYILTTRAFQLPNSSLPKSPPIPADSAAYPLLLGPPFRLHAGFLLAIAATVLVWWLLERSTIGFEIRAVGANANAARTAGMSVERVLIFAMVFAGLLAGLGGSAQVLGTERVLTTGVAASYGFDAITVALLGRSRPWGTFLAGLLFGALKAGGFLMQSTTSTPIDIILVVQSVIVLLIAAPPLVRAIFRLPAPGRPRRTRTAKEAAA
ncbi:ABC transporter permease [Georgenia sp. 10Sc9-8]|uniref:ABC transporter permease n=1 Tax=Georgenia halotolerans TaxID=3028317 RepID=A0ABT5TY82_9MICO|nr:ABC transporter permease [Georgenia halotolerans]